MKLARTFLLPGFAATVLLASLPTLGQQGGSAGGVVTNKQGDGKTPPPTGPNQDAAKGIDKQPKSIGPAPLNPGAFAPVRFDSGPFEGLEPFGYSYFSAARQFVHERQRALAAEQPTQTAGAPIQMSSKDINLPAPDRYQLGPGDKITVRYGSAATETVEVALLVGPTGTVTVPIMGSKLTVRGMTLNQAQNALQREIGKGLRDATVTVTLSELRSISVSIVGEVTVQGTYQFPNVITLFNALYAAGGPTINGSMRKIQLRRSNGKSLNIDLYSYLVKGDDSQDVPLQPGDLILVPMATNRVAIKGEVQRPAVYELTEKESLKDALDYAGGPKASAVTDQIEIDSYHAGQAHQIVNVNVSAAVTTKLKPEDIVTLYPVRTEFQNTIEVEGAVDQPRKYELTPNMTVADAISRAHGALSDAYLSRADLYRENPDRSLTLVSIDLGKAMKGDSSANIELKRHDRLKVYFQRDVTWLDNKTVNLEGAVRTPGKYVRMDGMKLRDLLLQGGGLSPDASLETIFIYRKLPDGNEGPLIQVDGQKMLAGTDDVVLQDRDRVVVYTVQQAKFSPRRTVIISGAVQQPGTYPRSENLRLSDLIKIAGGLTPNTGPTIQISHSLVPENTKTEAVSLGDLLQGKSDLPLRDGDVVTIPARGDFQNEPILVEVRGRVLRPGVYAMNSRTETLDSVIKQAGGLTTDGWAEGAQFLRDPKNMQSDAEGRLSPRVKKLFETIHETQYVRALAKSDLDKIRILSVQAGSLGIAGLASLGGLSLPTQVPSGVGDSDAAKKLIHGHDLVSPARDLGPDELEDTGNIPIRLDLALKDTKSPHNVVLKDRDIIIIPEKPTTVAVRGAVFVPSTVLFEGPNDLQHYLDQCGGPTIDADKDQILIIRATGTITKAKPSTKILLGDTIFVPTKVMVAQLFDGQANFDQGLQRVTNLGIFYAILKNLIK